jgi:multidrug efflux pump subunit AcrA (membrane-fusion protein)
MFARVAVVLAARENAQLVPAPALVAHDGGAGIFVVDRAAAVARFVPVTVGISTPDVVEILAPEIRGPVVTLGQHLLADASPVLLPAAAPSAPADPR